MALEDFEKSLAEEKGKDQGDKSRRHREEERKHRHHHRHHHRDGDGQHRRKRDHSIDNDAREHRRKKHRHHGTDGEDVRLVSGDGGENPRSKEPLNKAKRDSWMEAPSSLDIEYTQKAARSAPEPALLEPQKKDFQLKIHENELNKHHLQDLADGKDVSEEVAQEETIHEVNYIIGDAGSQWRMKKLKRVYERAEEERRAVEDVASEQFGSLRSFDDAREEQIELERRATYGTGYVGKEKPNGDLFAERKLDMGVRRQPQTFANEDEDAEDGLDQILEIPTAPAPTTAMDQTALNRLKAQMMKAKLRGGPQAAALEAEYNAALSNFSSPTPQSSVQILNPMQTRLLSANTSNEVTPIDNKRGRERGLVKSNEEMSIEDMVREEKRNRNHAGGAYENDSTRYATRIAKDAKFTTDHDYLDENASKLAQQSHKSTTTLRANAISSFHTENKIHSSCPLCHHEDTSTPPVASIVSLATRTYLTLPPLPVLAPLATTIVPIAHHANLLSCDDDEWEEVRNFMKSLSHYYASLRPPLKPLFYESAAHPSPRHHAVLHAVPLPPHLHTLASQFFKEAILASDEEWSQHRKIIDTLKMAREGAGRNAVRKGLVREVPYFHVWFEVDGGMGHVVEDGGRWPKGDGFARGVVGGMLGLGPEVLRREGRWMRGEGGRIEKFRKGWGEWDWTNALVEAG